MPWKTKTESHAGPSSSKPKSALDKRIETIRQNAIANAPSSVNSSAKSLTQRSKNKRKDNPFSLKISEISKSLQSQPIEIHDSDQEKVDDDDENIEREEDEEEDDDDAPISQRKPKRKRTKK